jgi:hypothetical protein
MCSPLTICVTANCRQQYTPNMPDTAAEGLLCDSDGRLLEGLITNLFVVAGMIPMRVCLFHFCVCVSHSADRAARAQNGTCACWTDHLMTACR